MITSSVNVLTMRLTLIVRKKLTESKHGRLPWPWSASYADEAQATGFLVSRGLHDSQISKETLSNYSECLV